MRPPDTLLAGRPLLLKPLPACLSSVTILFVPSELCQLTFQVLPQLISLLLQSASFIGGKNVKMKELKCQMPVFFPVTLDCPNGEEMRQS